VSVRGSPNDDADALPPIGSADADSEVRFRGLRATAFEWPRMPLWVVLRPSTIKPLAFRLDGR
jgi:hypothetical protein